MPPHLRAETASALKWVDIAPYDEAAARACVEALLRNDRRFEAREFLQAWRGRAGRGIRARSGGTRDRRRVRGDAVARAFAGQPARVLEQQRPAAGEAGHGAAPDRVVTAGPSCPRDCASAPAALRGASALPHAIRGCRRCARPRRMADQRLDAAIVAGERRDRYPRRASVLVRGQRELRLLA